MKFKIEVKNYFIGHFGNRHFKSAELKAVHKVRIASDFSLFSALDRALHQAGIWLCGECLCTHTFSKNCKHAGGVVVLAPSFNDVAICGIPTPSRLVLTGAVSDSVGSSGVGGAVGPVASSVRSGDPFCFDFDLIDRVFAKKMRTVKCIPPKLRLGFARIFLSALDKVLACSGDLSAWVQLLILPCCVLTTFEPANRAQRRSGERARCQFDCISRAILRWRDPGERVGLVRDRLAAVSPSFRGVKRFKNSGEANLFQCKRKLGDGHFTSAIKVLTSPGVAPSTPDTLRDLESKHPFAPPPALPSLPLSGDALSVHKDLVLDMIRSFPKGTSCGRDGLRAQHFMDILGGAASAIVDDLLVSISGVVNLFLGGKCPSQLGEFIASAPLTPLIKPGGGVRPIAVGTVWRRLVSKVASASVGKSVSSYLQDFQFGVGVSGGCEAILHSVNRFMEAKGSEVGYSMLLVDFKNAFNLIDRSVLLHEARVRCPSISPWVEFCYSRPARLYYEDSILWSCQGVQQGDPLGPLLFALALHPLVHAINQACELSLQAWYLDDGTIVGDTLVVARALDIIRSEGPSRGLFLNVDKTELFWPVEDPRGRVDGVFPSSISRPLAGVKLLGGSVSADLGFCRDLASKRVSKTISLMEAIHKLNDPQCELLLLRSCAGVAKLSYALRTCPPSSFWEAQAQFDQALRASLEKIVTAAGPGFGDWQWRLATLPIKLGGLGVLCAGDVIQYAFLASRLQSSTVQTRILSGTGITSLGPSFQLALDDFRAVCGVGVVDVTTSTFAPQIMKSLAKCYFGAIDASLASKYGLSSRQVALLSCVREPHAQDFLFTIPIDGLGQRMNPRQFRSVLCYRLAVPLFSEGSLCPSCSVHRMDQWGDHAIHCSSEVGVKFRHNLVRDVLIDICSKVGVAVRKEAPLGFLSEDGRDLRPADLLLFNWSQGKDACMDMTGISPFAGGGVNSWAPGVALCNAVEKKKRKYASICAANGYSFIPFAFSTLGELDKEALGILSRLKSISCSHSGNVKSGVFIYHRVSFCIQKGVGAQLVSRLPSNFVYDC